MTSSRAHRRSDSPDHLSTDTETASGRTDRQPPRSVHRPQFDEKSVVPGESPLSDRVEQSQPAPLSTAIPRKSTEFSTGAQPTGPAQPAAADDDLDVSRFVTPADRKRALAEDVRTGLTSSPKDLPPKWFYDARGGMLFDAITRLPEYYPTRAERGILATEAKAIIERSGADTLVELGSGSSEKTRLLLDALVAAAPAGARRRFVPVDVDESMLRSATAELRLDYPSIDIQAVVADFDRHLDQLPTGGRRLIAFLGGTIGNFPPTARVDFLRRLRAGMRPGDALLLGTDLVKDAGRLVAAYDDSAGVTAAFNRNVLSVVNAELGADFDPRAFAHVALWDAENRWIEMRLRSLRDQTVHVAALGLDVSFAAGEEMRTEISAKFTQDALAAEYAAAGLRLAEWWTDEAGDFALSLATPAPGSTTGAGPALHLGL